MGQVAAALDRGPPADEAAMAALLDGYVMSLRTIDEIDEAVRQRARGKPIPVPAAAPAEAAEPEPPPMTADEKARVAALSEVAGKLVGEGWDEIIAAISRYAGTVEAGFQVPRANRGAASSCTRSSRPPPWPRNSTPPRRSTRSTSRTARPASAARSR